MCTRINAGFVQNGNTIILPIAGVRNNGTKVVTGVQVQIEALPDGLEYVDHSFPKGTFDSETLVWNVGVLNVGESIAGQLTLAIMDSCELPFKVEAEIVSSASCETDTSDNTACWTIEGISCCDVQECAGGAGGGGGSAQLYVYEAGDGAFVKATGTGITAELSVGELEFDIPDGVTLISFRASGTPANLNSGELRLIFNGGLSSGSVINTSNATLYHPFISVQGRTQVLPTDPYFQRPDDAADSINIFDEVYSVAGQVSSRITGLSGDWGIKGQF